MSPSRTVMNPAMWAAWILGLMLALHINAFGQGWFSAKLALVVLLREAVIAKRLTVPAGLGLPPLLGHGLGLAGRHARGSCYGRHRSTRPAASSHVCQLRSMSTIALSRLLALPCLRKPSSRPWMKASM